MSSEESFETETDFAAAVVRGLCQWSFSLISCMTMQERERTLSKANTASHLKQRLATENFVSRQTNGSQWLIYSENNPIC